ncbi:MAG: multi-sensor hybrid histidine kinase [Thermoleophilia bacterium]|nr:multi-sensor hybrid histidine kinase [Thermoleophilia bacterium]
MIRAELIPPNEPARIAAVHRYDILDTPTDGTFDRITRLASTLLDMPVAIVSIVDTDRIWFKSHHGLDAQQIDRDPGLCASAILGTGAWVIEDAEFDPRTLANPLVASENGVRFYAGVPLTTQDGFNLGTMCVLDTKPREFPEDRVSLLQDLAAIVMDEMELRLAARTALATIEERARQATEMNDDVVQSLAVAKLALDLGNAEEAGQSISSALVASRRILDELAQDLPTLRRTAAVRI